MQTEDFNIPKQKKELILPQTTSCLETAEPYEALKVMKSDQLQLEQQVFQPCQSSQEKTKTTLGDKLCSV